MSKPVTMAPQRANGTVTLPAPQAIQHTLSGFERDPSDEALGLGRAYFPRYGAITTGNPGRTHGILHMVDTWPLYGHLFL